MSGYKRYLVVAALLLLGAGLTVTSLVVQPARRPAAPPRQPAALKQSAPPSPEALAAFDRIKPHLKDAETRALAAVEKSYERARAFFTERRKRTHAFAEETLSLRSKWEFLKGQITGGKGHQHFLHQQFEEKVFSQKELADLLNSVVAEYLETLKGIENELLIKVRADLEDAAPAELRSAAWLKTDQAFHGEFDSALKQVTATITTDLTVQLGREVVSWVAADVAASIATSLCITIAQRLGVSAAITGSSLVSGVATLGLGIVAGLLIDSFLDWLLQSMGYNPVGEVQDQIDLLVEDFEGVLLFGDYYQTKPPVQYALFPTPRDERIYELRLQRWAQRQERKRNSSQECKGLYVELADLYEDRANVRDAALKNLILGGAP